MRGKLKRDIWEQNKICGSVLCSEWTRYNVTPYIGHLENCSSLSYAEVVNFIIWYQRVTFFNIITLLITLSDKPLHIRKQSSSEWRGQSFQNSDFFPWLLDFYSWQQQLIVVFLEETGSSYIFQKISAKQLSLIDSLSDISRKLMFPGKKRRGWTPAFAQVLFLEVVIDLNAPFKSFTRTFHFVVQNI